MRGVSKWISGRKRALGSKKISVFQQAWPLEEKHRGHMDEVLEEAVMGEEARETIEIWTMLDLRSHPVGFGPCGFRADE